MQFTKEFLESVFENQFEGINVVNVDVSDLLSSGENYTCKIKRIEVTYTLNNSKDIRIVFAVAKCLPDNEGSIKFAIEMNVFDCEINVYNSVLSRLSAFDYWEKMSPLMYYASLQPEPVFILQDLVQLGYKPAPRNIGLDLEQCLLVIGKLAYFHAATVALHEQDPTILPKHELSLFRKTETMDKIVNAAYEEAINVCQSRPELYRYMDKLREGKERILERLYNVHKTKSNFKVLNHGDFWMNNFLLHENSDVAFVDFQLSCFTSPCFDLHYFLATSVKYEAMGYKSDIVDHYFATLMKYLKKLHTRSFPKREEFDKDFRSMSYCGFGGSIVTLALVKATQKDGASVDNFIAHDEIYNFRHHCFHSEVYVNEMIHYLPYYESLGIFDEF